MASITEVMPADKDAAIAGLQAEGNTVAILGDGVNDAAALARADFGLATGTGTDVAIEAGDLTLVRGDLLAVVAAIRLSRRTLSTITSNLLWAFACNTAALPLGRSRAAQPHDRRRGDGVLAGARRRQQLATAPLPAAPDHRRSAILTGPGR